MKITHKIWKWAANNRRKTAALLVVVVLFTGISFYRYSSSPVNPPLAARIVDIPKGAGFLRITEILNEAGFVKNRPFFWALALVKQATLQIRAGEYEFTGVMSPLEILAKLVRGEIKDYKVMLPEDLTVSEVAKRLLEDKLINEEVFMTLATDRDFLASLDIEADSIEGYLYPNTYKFDRSMTTKEVIRIIVRQFWKEITPEMSKRAEELGFTINEWVTLASIIGKESANREEKALISAVFHNRLKRGMKLQSDPTAVYRPAPEGTPVKTIRKKDLLSDTPHNTYRISGLPPSPIANPGIDSLRAALYPARVGYFYFVATNDGAHHFSASLDEHNRAVAKYQINRQKK
ncbi:MAG: endolytic transglycosylase MltG [Proteobacteria bacterium]|nr:endolytic transglycosylase MltG [Pseudomonadota bacterium]MBU2226636.1 endolytic transglycosylase MltG [Pseudomonadota bacterium]MBU2262923.1 endolytic transglycosylase MltG [Pseudomonadota bacterium]